MKQRYNAYSHNLAWLAIDKCFQGKWDRNDVLTFVEEWAGYSREEIWQCELAGSHKIEYEIKDALAYTMDEVVDGILNGDFPDMDAVLTRERPDGMTGKIREIAYLCIMHQLLGHIVKLGLEPLFNARILPTQHASIPGHGQTKLALQVRRYLNKSKLGIAYYAKTDCTGAYKNLMYEKVIALIEKEIPSAKWILALLRFLASYAPGGHLIIGGYLDAWLFNFVMSYAIREALSSGYYRRGRFIRNIERIESFMDDCAFLSRTRSGIMRAIAVFENWVYDHLGMVVRKTTGVIKWFTVAYEKCRKKLLTPAMRGCPSLDMGGFRIFRTHITIRARIFKRIVRTFTRAWTEYCTTGTIQRQRARSLIARNGPLSFADSYSFKVKYHVDQLMSIAKSISAYWGRVESRKRKEKMAYALYRSAKWLSAA